MKPFFGYRPQPYRSMNRGGRTLLVPCLEDRRHHQELYRAIRGIKPVSWRPEELEGRIRSRFQDNPGLLALRADIKDCFQSLPQDLVRRRIHELPVDPGLRQDLCRVLDPVPRGLPTGSPLSPWLAELVLADLDAAMSGEGTYFRYVDDICVLGSRHECEQALVRLQRVLTKLGMEVNDGKTRIVSRAELVFLGRSFRELEAAALLEVDLGGEAFRLPNEKTLVLRVNSTGRPYLESPGRITYSLDCLLNRLSQQPTPFILEMLLLRPACKESSLARIIREPESIFDQRLPWALHGKIYRHYIHQVRDRVKMGTPLPIGAAGEVFRWLHLTKTIMETGRLPENYHALGGDWAGLHTSLQAGNYEPYHQRIKQLFRLEYSLRQDASRLPGAKRISAELE